MMESQSALIRLQSNPLFSRFNAWLFSPAGDQQPDRTTFVIGGVALGGFALLGLWWSRSAPSPSSPAPMVSTQVAPQPSQQEKESPTSTPASSNQPQEEEPVLKVTDQTTAIRYFDKGITPDGLGKLEQGEVRCLGQFARTQSALEGLLDKATPDFILWVPLVEGACLNTSIPSKEIQGALLPHIKLEPKGKAADFRMRLLCPNGKPFAAALFETRDGPNLLEEIEAIKGITPAIRSRQMGLLYVGLSPEQQGTYRVDCLRNPQRQCDLLVAIAQQVLDGKAGAEAILSDLRAKFTRKEAYIKPDHLKSGDMISLYLAQRRADNSLSSTQEKSQTYQKEVVSRLESWTSEVDTEGFPFPFERILDRPLKPEELTDVVKLAPRAQVHSTLVVWCVSKKRGADVAGVIKGFEGIPYSQIRNRFQIVTQLRNTGGTVWWIDHAGSVAAALRKAIDLPKGMEGVKGEEIQALKKFFDDTLKQNRPEALKDSPSEGLKKN